MLYLYLERTKVTFSFLKQAALPHLKNIIPLTFVRVSLYADISEKAQISSVIDSLYWKMLCKNMTQLRLSTDEKPQHEGVT